MEATVLERAVLKFTMGLCDDWNDIADIPLSRIFPVDTLTAFLSRKIEVSERKDFLEVTTVHASPQTSFVPLGFSALIPGFSPFFTCHKIVPLRTVLLLGTGSNCV